jgi:hypothetical protein
MRGVLYRTGVLVKDFGERVHVGFLFRFGLLIIDIARSV